MSPQFIVWVFACVLAMIEVFLTLLIVTVLTAAFNGLSMLTWNAYPRSFEFLLVEGSFVSTVGMYIFLLLDKCRREEFRSIYVKILVAAPLIIGGLMLYLGQDNEVRALCLLWVSVVFFSYQCLVCNLSSRYIPHE